MDAPPPEDFDPYGARVNYGRIENGNKAFWWVMGGLMGLYVMLTGGFILWAGSSLVELKTDMAVLKCQLSPDCKKVAQQ